VPPWLVRFIQCQTRAKWRVFQQALKATRLTRSLEITIDGRRSFIKYFGNGSGFEAILVNNELACKKRGIIWFVPRFEFNVDEHMAVLEVRVGLLFKIRSVRLSIDGLKVYEEGPWPAA
jgi:hypothetical protein